MFLNKLFIDYTTAAYDLFLSQRPQLGGKPTRLKSMPIF